MIGLMHEGMSRCAYACGLAGTMHTIRNVCNAISNLLDLHQGSNTVAVAAGVSVNIAITMLLMVLCM